MLVRHGQVVAEGWWEPYAANERHALYSLSKSFTSTAVGLAIADGKLSVDDPVLRFFPEEAPSDPSANLRAMRVRDLLTMSTGHHDEDVRNFPYTSDENVVKNFLARPVSHKPGTFFFYNTPASYMLSAIVQKVTGQPVLEYLRPRLFEPLGITDPTWDASKQGVSLGGFGLSVRTEDIASFGQLYLQKGEWRGKQLVPAAWIDAATARQMSNGSSPSSDWEQGYGYQFWRSRHGFYRGDGAHGQFCLVLPQYDAVIAITSGTRDMASVMNLVWDRLVPALKPAATACRCEVARRAHVEAEVASPEIDRRCGALRDREDRVREAIRLCEQPADDRGRHARGAGDRRHRARHPDGGRRSPRRARIPVLAEGDDRDRQLDGEDCGQRRMDGGRYVCGCRRPVQHALRHHIPPAVRGRSRRRDRRAERRGRRNADDAARGQAGGRGSLMGELAQRLSYAPRDVAWRAAPKLLPAAALVAAGYYLGALIGFRLRFPASGISFFWPPTAVLTAALLLTAPRAWGALLTGAFVAHAVAHSQNGVALLAWPLQFLANALQAVLAAYLVRRYSNPLRPFGNLQRAGAFIVGACIVAPALASVVAASLYVSLGWASSFASAWSARAVSNAIASLTLVPPIVMVWPYLWARPKLPTGRRVFEFAVLFASILAAHALVRQVGRSDSMGLSLALYAPAPFLLWATVRFGGLGLSVALLTTTLLTISSALRGEGAFGSETPL